MTRGIVLKGHIIRKAENLCSKVLRRNFPSIAHVFLLFVQCYLSTVMIAGTEDALAKPKWTLVK